MDQARFDEAKNAYDSGDYRAAAKGFLAAAGRETEGAGAAYHMAGNSLMRLRRHSDAVTVYQHAVRDELYEKRGAVRANLAATGLGLSLHPNQQALQEYPEVAEPYRAIHDLLEAPAPDHTVQMLARLGFAPEGAGAVPPAPRRGLERQLV